jgi:hypothetical protein
VIQPPAPPCPPFDYDLGAETNDFGYHQFPWGAGRCISPRVSHLFDGDDPTAVTYVVRDKSLRVSSTAGPVETEFIGECVFRIDTGLWDEEQFQHTGNGCNDGVLWLGLNRVVKYTDRSGQGAEFAEITVIGSGPPPYDDEAEEQ